MTRGTAYWRSADSSFHSRVADALTLAQPAPPVAGSPAAVAALTSLKDLTISVSGTGSSATSGRTISSYLWSWGDRATSTKAADTHTYSTAGSYPVTLTVTDSTGVSNSTKITVNVTTPANLPPVVTFTLFNQIDLSLSASVASSTDPDGIIVSTSWTFGDGGAASGPTATHAYAAPGSFPVTVTCVDNRGASTTLTRTATPTAPNMLPVIVIDTPVYSGLSVSLSAQRSYDSDGVIVSTVWDFGDGGSASGASVSHTYAGQGPWTVTVTCTDDDNGVSKSSITVSPRNS